MSKKKDKGREKKQRHWLSSSPLSGGGQAGALPEEPRRKLLELFGQIEQQFEQLYTENAARELAHSHTRMCTHTHTYTHTHAHIHTHTHTLQTRAHWRRHSLGARRTHI